MKTKKIFILPLIIMIASASLTTCENQIINKWWEDDELDYVALIKNIPIYEAIIEEKTVYEFIYQTIYLTLPQEIVIEYVYVEKPLPPEILLQYINVVDIEFVLFSGDQKEYNKPSTTGGTSLKPEEISLNKLIVKEMADSLKLNDKQLIILHGHANPVSNTPDELIQLEELSSYRAAEVARELEKENIPDLENRITVRGYGGGKNLSGSGSSTYAGLNRRVEMILIEIETVPGNGVVNKRGR